MIGDTPWTVEERHAAYESFIRDMEGRCLVRLGSLARAEQIVRAINAAAWIEELLADPEKCGALHEWSHVRGELKWVTALRDALDGAGGAES